MVHSRKQKGFTLMEIVVATTIFVLVMSALMTLFNYVLQINRRGEALRQASQGMRDFVEFLVKEVRNGQIDYYVQNGSYSGSINNSNTAPCLPPAPGTNPVPANVPSTYQPQSNWLGILNTDNIQECFYYGHRDGTYIDTVRQNPTTFTSTSSDASLVLQKAGVPGFQVLNPLNLTIQNLMFVVRPTCDPYSSSCVDYSNGFADTQPSVTILIKFLVKLGTGEQVPIFYQTSVSSYKYDIPH